MSTNAHSYEVLQKVHVRTHITLSSREHADGARTHDPEKYLRDAALLKKVLEKEPENARYAFFYAESLRWAGDEKGAVDAYRKRVSMDGDAEEVYWSLYCLAKLTGDLGLFCRAHQFRPSRVEPLYELGNLFSGRKNWLLVWLISRYALPSPLSTDMLFVESWIYDWGSLLQYAIASLHLGKSEEAATAFQALLQKEGLPDELRKQISIFTSSRNSALGSGLASAGPLRST